ncbi:MAG: FecR domain-containing protein [Verrucomicrobiota bacterium]
MKRSLETVSAGDIEATASRWISRRDAGLSPEEERELEQWLEADPRHREAMNFYGSTWAALAKPAQAGKGDELQRQLAMLARGRRRRLATGSGVLALALLLTLGVATWKAKSVEGLPEASAVVLLPSRQTLPDGSVVELKGDARITVDYSAALRRVALEQGEAHFSVEKDAARPFIVSSGGVDVRAVGTAFSVQRGADAVEVLVTHGVVAVDHTPVAGAIAPTSTETAPPVQPAPPLATLDMGKRVTVELAPTAAAPAVSEVSSDEIRERLAWRVPRLEFTKTPLGEAVALLNQYALPGGERLAIVDPAVATMRVSGVFRADNIEAFVVLLEGAFGVKVERSPGVISLRK